MASWRDELLEVVKSKTERDAEENERKKKRLTEALVVAVEALAKAFEGLRFANEQLSGKEQPVALEEDGESLGLKMREQSLNVALTREDAIVRVTFNDGRPREFDFDNDRHLSAKDVEEYVGRRAVEFVRAAQKSSPW